VTAAPYSTSRGDFMPFKLGSKKKAPPVALGGVRVREESRYGRDANYIGLVPWRGFDADQLRSEFMGSPKFGYLL
jgi:hypothetical protein